VGLGLSARSKICSAAKVVDGTSINRSAVISNSGTGAS